MILRFILSLIILFLTTTYFRLKKIKSDKTKAEALKQEKPHEANFIIGSRDSHKKIIKGTIFDICIIGGGSTGAGIALEAATQGLKVCLVEKGDFGSGTSSKSTKLLHGGVRYLEKVMKTANLQQLKLVIDALNERHIIMNNSPYLSSTVKILVPLYKKSMVVFYWLMLKIYDLLSFGKSLGRSYFVNKDVVSKYFGQIQKRMLVGGMVYFDGTFNDSRLNIMLVLTAEYYGLTCLNYAKVIDTKCVHGIKYTTCKDLYKDEIFVIKSKILINATGPYTDFILRKNFCSLSRDKEGLNDYEKSKNFKEHQNIMVHSVGSHISLPLKYAPENMGMVDRRTADGRMLFIIPFKDKIIAGSTETRGFGPDDIIPKEKDLIFLLKEVQKYNQHKIKRSEITSIWSGVRPLIKSKEKNTENIVRNYKIIDKDGIITVTGGKWTTYRKAAETTMNHLRKNYALIFDFTNSITKYVKILGSENYSNGLFYEVASKLNVDVEYAKHLTMHYGSRAFFFRKYSKKYFKRVYAKYLFTYAEVLYVFEQEHAIFIGDIVNRRFQIGLCDVKDAEKFGMNVIEFLVSEYLLPLEKVDFFVNEFYKDLDEFGLLLVKNK